MDLLQFRIPGATAGDITKQTVKDQVADKLAYMIHTGLLRPGDELPSERELSATLGVSRESVRRAIADLAARRMIGVSQGSRTKVLGASDESLHEAIGALRSLKGRSIEEVTQARTVVEVEVIRLAAAHMNKATLARLDSLLSEQSLMLSDPVRFQISDREFHMALYAACGNQLLANFVSDLYSYALDVRRKALSREGAIARSVADHQMIVDALKSRQPETAADAALRHLDRVYSTTLRELKKGKR
jgi:DNA-binding FadR family transcriptional regulator